MPSDTEGIGTVPLPEVIEFCITHQVDEVLVFVEAPSIGALVYETLMEHGIHVDFAIDEITGVNAENKMLGHTGALSTLELERYSFGTQQMLYLTIKRVFDIVFGVLGCVLTVPIIGVAKVVYVLQGDTHPSSTSKSAFDCAVSRSTFTRSGPWSGIRRRYLRSSFKTPNTERNGTRISNLRTELEAHNGSSLYNKVKPGITGWWECNSRSNIEYRERLELKYHYVRHCSLYLDTVCVIRTCAALIKHDGAQ